MLRIGLIISFLCLAESTLGQVSTYIDGKLRPAIVSTNQEAEEFAQRQLNELIREGYLFSGIDSIVVADSIKKIFLHKGEKVKLVIDSVNINGGEFRLNRFVGRDSKEVLNEFSSNGYPFVKIFWSDITQDKKERIHATLNIDPGPFITNDTIALLNPPQTKSRFIQQTIELEAGESFDETAYQNIEAKLKRINFLELKAEPDIAFSGGQATTYLNINEKESSSFEGILGFLPNQRTNGNLLLTGYLDLSLGNLFNSGKQLDLNWQQFAPKSQQLSIDYDHPYLLGSRMLLGAGFELVKQDSAFITRNFTLNIGTYLWDYLRFDGSYTRFASDLISQDVQLVSNQSFADYATDLYALRISKVKEINTFSSYWNYEARITFGRKMINRNLSLPADFYDSISTLSTISRLDMHTQWQQILLRKTAFFLQNDLGLIENKQILKNELYRIGGLKSLRGFNENFFFAQYYFLNKIELRQYFEQNSFLMVFYDQLVINNSEQWSYPMGIGLGFSLATTNGLFSFAFALGNSRESQFDVNNTKIHLGYTSKF